MHTFYILVWTLGASLFATEAWAGRADALKHYEDIPVYCEYYLTGPTGKKAMEGLKEKLLDRPFLFTHSEAVSDFALSEFGLETIAKSPKKENLILSVEVDERADFPVLVRLQLHEKGKLAEVLTGKFPDSTPTLWNKVFLSNAEADLDYDTIVTKYPLDRRKEFLKEAEMGFRTDPDVLGAQGYVLIKYYRGEHAFSVELGLNVPCEKIDKYVTDEWWQLNQPDKIRTSFGTLCRIPVGYFKRPDYD